MYVSVCLSVREHISETAGPIYTKFCVHIPGGRGSVLIWQRCDTLCTSGFMNDVTFGRTAIAAVRYQGGVSCLLNASFTIWNQPITTVTLNKQPIDYHARVTATCIYSLFSECDFDS